MDSAQKRERNRRKIDIRAAKAVRRRTKADEKRDPAHAPREDVVNPGDPRLDPPRDEREGASR